ncbi:MAG: phosphoserine phosphatase SerB [Trueperaceae bacterium]|nr:phosphoserine phosphatase SerB [Trueperaceae bacterium]
MKLCVFDFDSTLMDGETIDHLAKAVGKEKEVRHITEQAMQGKLDFFEALRERVALLKGLPYQEAANICQNLPLMPGALELIAGLKQSGHKVIIFSGGFREATRHHARILGADAEFANFLHQKEGVLTGLVGGEMMTGDAKGKLLKRLQGLLGISKKDTVAVGDGANDLSMFAHATTKIAFCAKPLLKEAADHCIDTKDLRLILELV